ncbi:MAG: HAD family phosphatase [Acutalibacteraceae bacterium]|nr:HAD family phosphatase [Acutalibacteraceae bacterium]
MDIKGAIFDMDGTLIDSLGVWEIIWEELGVRFGRGKGFRPSYEDDRAIRTMLLVEGAEMIHHNYNLGENGEQVHKVAVEVTERFYREQVTLKEGVGQYLAYLKAKEVPMCIASATAPELIKFAAERCGLYNFVSKIISCADVGKGKEAPDVFYVALDYLGTKKAETCVFEDSALALTTAANAGFLTVGIYDKHTFDHDKLKNTATVYIDEGETMMKLVNEQN